MIHKHKRNAGHKANNLYSLFQRFRHVIILLPVQECAKLSYKYTPSCTPKEETFSEILVLRTLFELNLINCSVLYVSSL